MSSSSSAVSRSTGAYRWYALGALGMSYAFSFMDRQIVSILLEDLRAEFVLTDTQLGLLSGLAFALFYATLGIPIARLADRLNRVNIVALAVTVWSIMTAYCGTVSNFWQLFLGRVGVGVGEAGGNPPSHSIIADYFGSHERSLALSIYSLGAPVGAMLGLAVGGYIAEHYGWRMAFICAGLPGVALALLIKTTVREPERGRLDDHAQLNPPQECFWTSVRTLFANPVYRWVNLGHMAAVFVGYGMTVWKPSLYQRQFELSQSEVGSIVGVMGLLAGVPGMVLGGYLADRLSLRDRRWPAWLAALAVLCALPLYLAALWSTDWMTMTVLFGFGIFCYQLSHGPGLAIVQSSVPPYYRAQAAAFVFFLSNIFGLGLGPLLVGWFSDSAAVQYGGHSLTVGLSLLCSVLLPASFLYWWTAVAMAREAPRESGSDAAMESP